MREIEAVLFDADGTLVNTQSWVNGGFEYSLWKNSLPKVSRAEINKLGGLSLRECYKVLAPDFSDPQQLFTDHKRFQERNPQLAVLFEGALETINSLRSVGIKTGVVTARTRDSSLKMLKRLGISDVMDVIVSHEDVANQKPHPEPVLKALSALNVPPENAVMVGDTKPDIVAGKAAGLLTVGVTYGFEGQKIKEHGADWVVEDIARVFP